MSRYIDEEAVKKKIALMQREPDYQHENEDWRVGLYMAEDAIDEAPTADVVEVVCCRDCMYWKDTSCDTVIGEHWGECRKPLGDYRYCETAENDYCSYGERRSEDAT